MFFSRIVLTAMLAGLCWAQVARAADASAFDVLVNNHDGKPVMFQSTSTLKKGDVINVHAFNARPVMIMQIAMCDADCPHMHLVKTIPLFPYYAGTAVANQKFVIPENGHVSFWVQELGGVVSTPIITMDGAWSVNFVNRFMSFATPMLYQDSQPMPASAATMDDNTLRARYFHRTFITVRLADSNS
ncbi:hypothetical protein [Dyella psychrodurans]|uniref:Plastocyanin n=1 Tax=Dyella psychrodurans TaxID=1927960 RepID=A0A370XC30_9GAMM|nr:hypothetical protein [Dyella psychrodurans]RDS85801.1 hypothetical protein DWU99_00555 [Dyella psychrodurans]